MKFPKLLTLRTKYERGFPAKKAVFFKLKKGLKSLEKTYSTDAHCVTYISEGVKKMPRINMRGESSWPHTIKKVWCFVDIDNPDHQPWTETLRKEVDGKLAKLPEFDHAGIYYTKGGLRLVWPLSEPINISFAEDWQRQFQNYIESATGLECDSGCLDWTRLYRLPFVVRDGEPQDLGANFDDMTFLDWSPPRPLRKGKFRTNGGEIIASEAPTINKIPAEEEYDLLKGSDYYRALVIGDALAEKGSRNSTTVKCLGYVVNLYGFTDPVDPYRLMYYSVKYQAENGSPKSNLDWFWGRCQVICAQQKGEAEKYEKLDPDYLKRPRLRKEKAAKAKKEAAEELENIQNQILKDAEVVKYLGVESKKDVHHRLIFIEPGGSFFRVFNENTCQYGRAVKSNRLFEQLITNCSRWAGRVASDTGKPPGLEELLRRYSRVEGTEVQWVYGQNKVNYLPDLGIVQEGTGFVRKTLTPKFDPQIDTWLRLLGGDKIDYLLDWLATLLDVQNPTCALYIHGPAGCGKGLLSEALGRIWGTSLTRYESVVGSNWNSSLLKCPLVLIDEGLSNKNKTGASSNFRQLIGTSFHELRIRYKSEQVLIGCPRLLITANNAQALVMESDLSAQDLEALKMRIGYIEVLDPEDNPENIMTATQYLSDLGGRQFTNAWVREDGIARHVLYLNESRKVEPGKRFLVEGWKSKLTDSMAVLDPSVGRTVSAILNLIMNPELKRNARHLFVGKGQVFLTQRTLVPLWENLVPSDMRPPTETRLANNLDLIKLKKGRKKLNGSSIRGWWIDPKFLLDVAKSNGTYGLKEVRDVINRPVIVPKSSKKSTLTLKPKKLKKSKKSKEASGGKN